MRILILCTSRPFQFPMNWAAGTYDRVISVIEDWPGGAGNGLGSLYAYKEARREAKSRFGIDLLEAQQKGASIALYQAAGMGKRLAPLSLTEGRNKGAVKLPWILSEESKPPSLLQMAIQMSPPPQPGRFGVFWSDQLISAMQTPTSTASVAILAIPLKKPWEWARWHDYGLLGQTLSGQVQLFDKRAPSALERQQIETLYLSLGSFSLSCEMTETLLNTFADELTHKRGKLDSDPHFWMPLTHSRKSYLQLFPGGEALFDRMQAAVQNLPTPLIEISDLGAQSDWWDFGSLSSYYKQSFAIKDRLKRAAADPSLHLDTDGSSYLASCTISRGRIRNSLLVGVNAEEVNCENTIIINSSAQNICATDALIYCVQIADTLAPSPKSACSQVNVGGKPTLLTAQIQS